MKVRPKEIEMVDHIAIIRNLKSDVQEVFRKGEFKLQDKYDRRFKDLERLEHSALELLLLQHDISVGAGRIDVAVIGDYNAGKSSFINSIIGEDVCPVGHCPTTSSITRIRWGRRKRIVQKGCGAISQKTYDKLARHPSDTSAIGTPVYEFDMEIPHYVLRDVTLIDTPGFENPENSNDTNLTIQAAQTADVLFFVMELGKGAIGSATLDILKTIKKGLTKKAPLVLILNQSNSKSFGGRKRIRDRLLKQHSNLFSDTLLYDSLLLKVDNDITSVDEMRKFLAEVAGTKEDIFKEHFRRHVQLYKKNALKFVSNFNNSLDAAWKEIDSPRGLSKIIGIFWKKERKHWKGLRRIIPKAVKESLEPCELQITRLWRAPYARNEFDPQTFSVLLFNSPVWQKLLDGIEELSSCEEFDGGEEVITDWIGRDGFNNIQDCSCEKASDCFIRMHYEELLDVHKDVHRAEEVKDDFIDTWEKHDSSEIMDAMWTEFSQDVEKIVLNAQNFGEAGRAASNTTKYGRIASMKNKTKILRNVLNILC